MMNILKFAVITYAFFKCGDCRWVIEVGMESYRNEESKAVGNLHYDQCCDPPMIEGACSNECDNYFEFCLQNASEIGPGSCEYGHYITDVIPGGDHLTFHTGTLDGVVPNPLLFSNDQWPDNDENSLNLLILMFDRDKLQTSDLVGSASIRLMLTPHEGVLRRASITGQYYQIYLNYSSRCATNYYGVKCDKYCMPRDDDNHGHYTCNSEGDIECLPGYHGVETSCITPNTDCEPECTDAHSFCNSFSVCECVIGWKGDHCSVPQCYQDCNGRGECVGPDVCECFKGWNGTFCNITTKEATITPTVSETGMGDKTTAQGPSIRHSNSISPQNTFTTVVAARTVMARNDDKITNYMELIIGLATLGGILFLVLVISVCLFTIIIFMNNRKHKLKSMEQQPDVITPGDNPNYSITMMDGPSSEATADVRYISNQQATNCVRNLENPTYTPTSNENQFIVSGYSLVSLSEDQTASVYHSNADGLDSSKNDTKYSNTVSNYDRTSHIVKKKKPATLYYSQPVLNSDYRSPSTEYDYVDANSGAGLIDNREISSSERKLDKKTEKDLQQFNKQWNIS